MRVTWKGRGVRRESFSDDAKQPRVELCQASRTAAQTNAESNRSKCTIGNPARPTRKCALERIGIGDVVVAGAGVGYRDREGIPAMCPKVSVKATTQTKTQNAAAVGETYGHAPDLDIFLGSHFGD